jgi:peroxiredoxin
MPAARPGGRRCAALLAGLALACAPGVRAGLPVGSPAPPFVAVAIDGAPLDLAVFRGHVVIVNFWATWCPPCRDEMPSLDAFYRTHRELGVDVIGISVDRRRDLGDVQRVMKAYAYTAALLSAARSSGWPAPNALPMTYVLDRDGRIAAVFTPGATPVTEATLEAAVAPLLPAPAAAP